MMVWYNVQKVSVFGVILDAFSRIRTDSVFSPNTGKSDQNNSEYRHFLRTDTLRFWADNWELSLREEVGKYFGNKNKTRI